MGSRELIFEIVLLITSGRHSVCLGAMDLKSRRSAGGTLDIDSLESVFPTSRSEAMGWLIFCYYRLKSWYGKVLWITRCVCSTVGQILIEFAHEIPVPRTVLRWVDFYRSTDGLEFC
jgi:hypothetical protein